MTLRALERRALAFTLTAGLAACAIVSCTRVASTHGLAASVVAPASIPARSSTPRLVGPELPSFAEVYVRVDGVEATWNLLGSLGSLMSPGSSPPEPFDSAFPTLVSPLISLRDGRSVARDGCAGVLLATYPLMGSSQRFAAFFAVASTAAQLADLSTPPKTTVFPLGATGLVAEMIPGGLIFASDAAYLVEALPFATTELERHGLAQGTISGAFAMSRIADDPSYGDSMPTSLAPLMGLLKLIDRADFIVPLAPDAFTVSVDLVPTPHSSVASAVLDLSGARPPSVAGIPGTFGVQVSSYLPASALVLAGTVASAAISSAPTQAAAVDLLRLAGPSIAFAANPPAELVARVDFRDSSDARAGLTGLLATEGFTAVTKDALLSGFTHADRLSMLVATPDKPSVAYVACPAGSCVVALAATDAQARSELKAALTAAVVAPPTAPVVARAIELLDAPAAALAFEDVHGLAATGTAVGTPYTSLGVACGATDGILHVSIVFGGSKSAR